MGRRSDRRWIVVATVLGSIVFAGPLGCSNQYEDVGKIDISAAKKAAADKGIKETDTPVGRASAKSAGGPQPD